MAAIGIFKSTEMELSRPKSSARSGRKSVIPTGSDIFRQAMNELREEDGESSGRRSRKGNGDHVDGTENEHRCNSRNSSFSQKSSSQMYCSCKRFPWVCVRTNGDLHHNHTQTNERTPTYDQQQSSKGTTESDISISTETDSDAELAGL